MKKIYIWFLRSRIRSLNALYQNHKYHGRLVEAQDILEEITYYENIIIGLNSR